MLVLHVLFLILLRSCYAGLLFFTRHHKPIRAVSTKEHAHCERTIMQLILVSPILPGRTEICRRFVQEISTGRGDAYAVSRSQMGIDEERIWIHETVTAATVIILMETASPDHVLHALATSQRPFDCWFRQELLTVSGLDLAEASYKLMPELVSSWR